MLEAELAAVRETLPNAQAEVAEVRSTAAHTCTPLHTAAPPAHLHGRTAARLHGCTAARLICCPSLYRRS